MWCAAWAIYAGHNNTQTEVWSTKALGAEGAQPGGHGGIRHWLTRRASKAWACLANRAHALPFLCACSPFRCCVQVSGAEGKTRVFGRLLRDDEACTIKHVRRSRPTPRLITFHLLVTTYLTACVLMCASTFPQVIFRTCNGWRYLLQTLAHGGLLFMRAFARTHTPPHRMGWGI